MNKWEQSIYQLAGYVLDWEDGILDELEVLQSPERRAEGQEYVRDKLRILLQPVSGPLVYKAPDGVIVVWLDDGCVVCVKRCPVLESEVVGGER